MNTQLIFDDPDRVAAFVGERIGRTRPWWGHAAIGLERDGDLIAGAVFEHYHTHKSVQGHVAAIPGRNWANPEFVCACFWYAFVQLGVQYLYAHIDSENAPSLRMVEHLGFKRKCVLEGASEQGDDVIYVMRPDECRFLEMDHVPAQS